MISLLSFDILNSKNKYTKLKLLKEWERQREKVAMWTLAYISLHPFLWKRGKLHFPRYLPSSIDIFFLCLISCMLATQNYSLFWKVCVSFHFLQALRKLREKDTKKRTGHEIMKLGRRLH